MSDIEKRDQHQTSLHELFILGLCVYVLVALAVDTFFKLDRATSTILNYADTGICLIFLADFFAKLATAPRKLQYLKWGWIDFVSSILMVGYLRWGRVVRVVRILRVLRALRSTKTLTTFIFKRRTQSVFTAAGATRVVSTLSHYRIADG